MNKNTLESEWIIYSKSVRLWERTQAEQQKEQNAFFSGAFHLLRIFSRVGIGTKEAVDCCNEIVQEFAGSCRKTRPSGPGLN